MVKDRTRGRKRRRRASVLEYAAPCRVAWLGVLSAHVCGAEAALGVRAHVCGVHGHAFFIIITTAAGLPRPRRPPPPPSPFRQVLQQHEQRHQYLGRMTADAQGKALPRSRTCRRHLLCLSPIRPEEQRPHLDRKERQRTFRVERHCLRAGKPAFFLAASPRPSQLPAAAAPAAAQSDRLPRHLLQL